jgi:hypothetical protein
MYATCLFCHTSLGTNEAIEPFPVGRRLAFDAEKGRLWVVCGRCGRWNLTPLEERWEAIEECERRFRATKLRASTDNIGLAKLAEGVELVRIGRPLLPEFAAWRYGAHFGRRRRRMLLSAGVGGVAAAVALPVVAPAVASVFGALVMASVLYGPVTTPVLGQSYLEAKDYWQNQRVVTHVHAAGRAFTIRAKHLRASSVQADDASHLSLRLAHDGGVEELSGADARRAGSQLLASANWRGATPALLHSAVEQVEQAADVSAYLRSLSARSTHGRRIMAEHRRMGALNLTPVERVALEIVLHEDIERRALRGELAELEQAWREAEEIAAITDDLLLPESVRQSIMRYRAH